MSYTPMSDLGQQGLFDITRTLLQQPDLASLCEALSQLVKRSALADNAAIVLWQAQTQRASYYASREKDTPIKYEDETVLAHGPRSEEHTSELQSRFDLVCRLLL